MRKLLILILLCFSISVVGQITPATVKRVASSTTTFITALSSGDILCDISSGRTYRILTACAGTNSLSTLVKDTDYIEIFGVLTNDIWFEAKDLTGTIFNAWKISKDNHLIPGGTVEITELFKQPDTWSNVVNVPILSSEKGDTVGIRLMVDDRVIAKFYQLADGAGAGTTSTAEINGILKVVDTLIGTYGRFTAQLQADSVNAEKYLLDGVDINKTGTLDSVAYRNRDNNFLKEQTVQGHVHATDVHATDSISAANFFASGLVKTAHFQLTTTPSNGYVLKCDADGNGSWQAITNSYQGSWNANTNTPTLADGVGTAGDFYLVSVGDTIDLGSGNVIFLTGGTAIYSGTVWEAINPSQIVTSVNGLIGDVQLNLFLDADTLSLTGDGDIDISSAASIVLLEDTVSAHNNRLIAIENDTTHFKTAWDSVAVFHSRLDDHTDSLKLILDTRLPAIENDTTNWKVAFDSVTVFHTRLDNHTDSLLAMYDSLAYYYLKTQTDSIASKIMDTLNLYADTIYFHRDSIITLYDSLAYYSLVADDDSIANDTWFRSETLSGQPLNAWKVTKDNNLIAGTTVELNRLFKQPDTWTTITNVPVESALNGDTVGVKISVDDEPILKIFGIADGAGGVGNTQVKILGSLIADSIPGYIKFTDTTSLIATKYDIDTLGFLRTETDPIWTLDSANVLHFADTTLTIATKYDLDTLSFLRSETDPIWAADSAKVLHFADTTAMIATKYDLDTLSTVTPAALTKVDDTNVTLTLGGTPATSLLQPVSITVGWTGILGSSRGGTGNGFTKFTGPASTEKTYTLPNANATLARTDAGQTFTGVNTMADSLLIPDIAYSTQTWNNSSAPPTKNAIRDKIEAIAASKFIVQGTTNSHLPGAQFLGSLPSGIVTNITTSGILSTIPDLSTYWTAGYNDKINSAGFSTSTGVLTLNQQDAGTVTVDLDGRYLTTSSAYQPLFPNVVNDITLANQYNKVFSKPNDEYTTVSGLSRPHASLVVDDYYFILDREYPAHLLRFDPDNLAGGATDVTFPTSAPYGAPEQMIYLPTKGMIYIYFALNGSLAIVEVNPSTLAYSTVISLSVADAIQAGPMVSDGTYLYFATNAAAGSTLAEKVYQYRLSDWAYINNVVITGADASFPHAIAYDGNSLYISTTEFDVASLNNIWRVDLPGLTKSTSSATIFSTMCDEMVITGNKIYIGKESADGHIIVIDKPGYGIVKDSIYTGISAPCYGVFFDGNQIWATMGSAPGGLSRIDPQTGEVAYWYAPTGCDLANEISWHGGRMLTTFYQYPNMGVGRICLPKMISVARGSLTNPMTASQDMIVGGADGVPTRLPKGNDGDILGITSGVIGWKASGGGSMVYPSAGIPLSTGSAWNGTSIIDNSGNWNTAFLDRLKWDGGSTGLVAATGRSSLGLGDMALETKANYALLNNPTFTTGINLANTGIASFNTDDLQLWGNGEGFLSSKENNVAIGVKDGGGDFEYVMKANYNAGNSSFEAMYNGSKVVETDADGLNLSSGKVYQVNGTNGVSGTYTSPSSITVSGGIITSATNGSSGTVTTAKITLDYSDLTNMHTNPALLINAGTGNIAQVLGIIVHCKINDGTYNGGDVIFQRGPNYSWVDTGDITGTNFFIGGENFGQMDHTQYLWLQSGVDDTCANDGSVVDVFITYTIITL